MFWKKDAPSYLNQYVYLAILKIEPVNNSELMYGQKEFLLTLSDETTVRVVLDKEDHQPMLSRVRDGGHVLNG